MTLDKRYIAALSSENPKSETTRVQREIADEQRRLNEENQRQSDIVHSLIDLLTKDPEAGRAAVKAFLASLEQAGAADS